MFLQRSAGPRKIKTYKYKIKAIYISICVFHSMHFQRVAPMAHRKPCASQSVGNDYTLDIYHAI